jgi:hypothetical protein
MNVGLVIAGSMCFVLAAGHAFVGGAVLDLRVPAAARPCKGNSSSRPVRNRGGFIKSVNRTAGGRRE